MRTGLRDHSASVNGACALRLYVNSGIGGNNRWLPAFRSFRTILEVRDLRCLCSAPISPLDWTTRRGIVNRMKSMLLFLLFDLNALLGKMLRKKSQSEKERRVNLGGVDEAMFRAWFGAENLNSPTPKLPTGKTARLVAEDLWERISPPEKLKMSASDIKFYKDLKEAVFTTIKRHSPNAPCDGFDIDRFGDWFFALAEQERKASSYQKWPKRPLEPHFMRARYNQADIYGYDWRERKSIISLSMVAVSGGVFRTERLAWQRRLQDFPKDNLIEGESREEVKIRIGKEVGGEKLEEPWTNTLQNISIFLANKEWFDAWHNAGNPGPLEQQEASIEFWTAYLKKLRRINPGLQVAELYQIPNPGFYAHMKIYDGQDSGHIIGCNLLAAMDAPNAFEVWWPPRGTKPPLFDAIEKSIDRIRAANSRNRIRI